MGTLALAEQIGKTEREARQNIFAGNFRLARENVRVARGMVRSDRLTLGIYHPDKARSSSNILANFFLYLAGAVFR